MFFWRAKQIESNAHGVFVPRSLFGDNAEIAVDQTRAADGTIRVTLYARPGRSGDMDDAGPALDCSRELRWVAEHRDEFLGEWVALEGDRLLSHGRNAKEVYETARNSGVRAPVLVQVNPVDDLRFGGW